METTPTPAVSAKELIDRFGGLLVGDPLTQITSFASLKNAHRGQASFLASPKYQADLALTQASLLIIKDAHLLAQHGLSCTAIVAPDPYLYFARAAQWLIDQSRKAAILKTIIHPSAVVHASAVIGDRVRIGPQVVIGANCKIEDDCDIGPGCILGDQVCLGQGSTLFAHVVIYSGCQIGQRAMIHSGAVIGADGFGFAPTQDQTWQKIPQVGGVLIGHDVEIGANTCIDRGTLDHTRIGNGVKLDNQIQIAHNVVIGDHTAIAACAGIAGSATIGAYCQIGGAAGVLGHLSIADHTIIGPMSLVSSSITQAGKYVGAYPLQTQDQWERSAAIVRRLPQLRRQVQALKSDD